MALKRITEEEMNAQGVIAAPDILNGTPAQNKAIFDRMVRSLVAPAYNACVDVVNELTDTDAGIQKNEAQRETAEESRAEAEEERNAAEEARENSEQERTGAETARNDAETERKAAEAARKAAETERSEAEEGRKTAEQGRKTAEETRAAAETEREQTFSVMRNRIEQLGVAAETLQAGAAATAEVEVDPETGGYKITLGIPKGRDGEGGGTGNGDMLQATYDPQGKAQDVFAYADNKVKELSDSIDKKLEDAGGASVYEATISTAWTEDENTGAKSQIVAISGVTADNTAKVDHSSASVDGTSDGYATFVEEENQYLTYITNGFAETVAGGIKFTIFGDAPTVSIPIVVEVV